MPKGYGQRQVKDLPKVLTRRLEWDSNLRPSGRNFGSWRAVELWITSGTVSSGTSGAVSSIRLTSPSFARWRHWLNQRHNVIDALCGCFAVKFDFCNNLLSSVHTILVIILRYVRLHIKTKILYYAK